MAERLCLKFLTDNCVPDSVGIALADAGHEVIRLRDILPTNSPDPIVASVAELNEAILVSFDKDFKTLVPRVTVDWDISQADDFRTRGVPWKIKRTSLERGRARRSDRKSLA